MKHKLLWGTALLVSTTGICNAQFALTARDSDMYYQYVHGFGGTVFTGNNTYGNNTLLASDASDFNFSDSSSGTFVGNPWSATVDTVNHHDYAVNGSVASFSSLQMNTSSACTTTVENATADITGETHIALDFTVSSTTLVQISGGVNSIAPFNRNTSDVFLYQWSAGTNSFIFWQIFGVTQNSTFSNQLTFAPNDYRIVVNSYSHATGDEAAWSNANVTLAAVPEPFTMVGALGLAGVAALRRRRIG